MNITGILPPLGLPALLPHDTAITTLTANDVHLSLRLQQAAPKILAGIPALYKKLTIAGFVQAPHRMNNLEPSPVDSRSADVHTLGADDDAEAPRSLLVDDGPSRLARDERLADIHLIDMEIQWARELVFYCRTLR